jgi:type I restriction enzyme S subunit
MNIRQAQLPEGDALNLPKGWEVKTLNEISENLDSKRVPITKSVRAEGSIPYYGASGIVDYVADYLFNESLLCISEDGANLLARTYPIAFSIAGKTWVNNHAHVLRFKNPTTQKFVEMYLNSIKLDDFVSGMAQPKLNQKMLNKIRIPLPPLPEQQRIVSILDKCFSAIERSRNNAEQNLKNAKELFESYLQGVFEKKGDGWVEKTLGEVLIKTKTIDPTKSPDAEFTYLDVSSVNKETKEIENTVILLGKDAPSRARKLVKTNDVIFATVRPTHSRVALITEEYNEQVCSTGYIVLRAKEYLNNSLVFYFLLTYGFNKQMEKLQKGASYPAVTDSEVKGIYIRYPKLLTEQLTIVDQLDALRAETQKLEAIYQKKIADLEELKKSVLQKAFSGELKTEKSFAV